MGVGGLSNCSHSNFFNQFWTGALYKPATPIKAKCCHLSGCKSKLQQCREDGKEKEKSPLHLSPHISNPYPQFTQKVHLPYLFSYCEQPAPYLLQMWNLQCTDDIPSKDVLPEHLGKLRYSGQCVSWKVQITCPTKMRQIHGCTYSRFRAVLLKLWWAQVLLESLREKRLPPLLPCQRFWFSGAETQPKNFGFSPAPGSCWDCLPWITLWVTPFVLNLWFGEVCGEGCAVNGNLIAEL